MKYVLKTLELGTRVVYAELMKKYHFRVANRPAALFTLAWCLVFVGVYTFVNYLCASSAAFCALANERTSIRYVNPIQLIFLIPFMGLLAWFDTFTVSDSGFIIKHCTKNELPRFETVRWEQLKTINIKKPKFGIGISRLDITYLSELGQDEVISIPWPMNRSAEFKALIDTNANTDNPLRSFLSDRIST